MVVIVFYATMGLYFIGEPAQDTTYDVFGNLALITSLLVVVVGTFVFALDTYGSRNESIIEGAVSPRRHCARLL